MSGRKDRAKQRGKAMRPGDYVMEVVQDLTCPICLEFYTYPIILPCSHVLCRRPCAENIFEVNFIRCPVCRDNCYITGGITSLPRVIPLESIIEKVRAERKKRAGLRKLAGSALQADISSDSVSSSGRETLREVTSTPWTVPNTPIVTSGSIATQQPPSSPDHYRPQNSSALRGASVACEELLDDYQRIMRSLDNPPNVTALFRNRNLTATSNGFSTPSPASPTNPSLDPALAVSLHRRSESPFSATPTNDVTAESTGTIIVDHEIEDIFCAPHSRNLDPCDFSPIQSTPRTLNPTSDFAEGSILGNANNVSTCSSQLPESEVVSRSEGRSSSLGHIAGSPHPREADETSTGRDTPRIADESSGFAEAVVIKHELQGELARLSDVQCRLLLYLTSYRDTAQRFQSYLLQDRSQVTSELDSLLAEIETRRNVLEERVTGAQREVVAEEADVTAATEKLLQSTQRLASFADQAVSAPPEVLQQTGPAILQELSSSIKTCELCLETSEPSLRAILTSKRFRVDFRHQRAVLRDLSFLKVPRPPVIDLRKCSRGHDTVMLVLTQPSSRDIVDSYRISYCSEEQKYLGIEETVTYNLLPPEEEDAAGSNDVVHPQSSSTLIFALIEHLCSSTHYYFRACAVNKAGQSVESELVQCLTLCKEECVVPVPSILENLSHPVSPTSVQIACHSPTTISPHQGVAHFLLYRPVGGACVWQGEEFQHGKEEHTVTGLRTGGEYQFLVLACNERGEGQVSEKISLILSHGR